MDKRQLLLSALFTLFAVAIFAKEIPLTRKVEKSLYDNVKVIKVIDADTLMLVNGERVSLIGVDAPELRESNKLYRDAKRAEQDVQDLKEIGRQAYEFTKQLVEDKYVRLEFDVQRFDKYARLLAYAYLPDGTFVNAEIIKQGYANIVTNSRNLKYADLFENFYQDARKNKRGLWIE